MTSDRFPGSIGRRLGRLLGMARGRSSSRDASTSRATIPAPPQYDWAEALHGQQMSALRTTGALDVLLVGDSLAQHWPLDRWSPWRAFGLGVGGDGTQHVLWRVERATWGACRPERILVVAGTNNLLAGDGPAAIAAGLAAIAGALAAAHPSAELRVLLPPPLGVGPADTAARRRALHKLLRRGFGSRLVDAEAALGAVGPAANPNYQADLIHLTDAGYAVLTDILRAAAEHGSRP